MNILPFIYSYNFVFCDLLGYVKNYFQWLFRKKKIIILRQADVCPSVLLCLFFCLAWYCPLATFIYLFNINHYDTKNKTIKMSPLVCSGIITVRLKLVALTRNSIYALSLSYIFVQFVQIQFDPFTTPSLYYSAM